MRLRRKPRSEPVAGQWSWCEPACAVTNTWHIRPLTRTGKHTGGGVDSASLCGRVVANSGGWDSTAEFDIEWGRKAVDARMTVGGFAAVCPRCVAAFPGPAPEDGEA